MGDCIDCGAEGTPVREARTDGGEPSPVRRCDSCQAREMEWQARWRESLRRARGPKVTTAAEPSVPPSADAPDRLDRAAFLAALDGIGA